MNRWQAEYANSVRPNDHPLKNMVDRGIFDSGCSGHMTGNKDQLEDFEEFNGGSVTFGGSKGYISGKGKNKSWDKTMSIAMPELHNRIELAERINRTLIEAARTMLADSLLPTTFWAEAVSCLNTLSVLGKFDGKSDEGFLVANPHAGASEVTNSAGTSQTPYSNASEERDEDVELIVVPSTVKNTKEKAESRKSSTNSKKEEILTEPQQEKKASSTDTSEDNPKILAFRRELEEIALKHLGKVSENIYSTP
ncbi:hypothetical protein Tco_0703568 [Tanacetum coccineum]|uniref:Retrovirus-related Pol polyprotein from transposon TNT 1-94-like beta-barrel domain-containing protein n=1 Tax=Tanacetum coccineum TaxID=301880 RepID=A0ABQ4Y020_9ASTR